MKKRITAFILVLAMMLPFASFAPNVFAESLSDYGSIVSVMIQSDTAHEYLTVDHGGATINLSARSWNFLTADGLVSGPAWCAQHGYGYPHGFNDVHLDSPYTNPQVTATLSSASGIISLAEFTSAHPDVAGLTEDEFGYASQVALWAALGQIAVPGTSFTSGAETLIQPAESEKLRVFKAIQYMCNNSGGGGNAVTGLHIRAEQTSLGDTVDLGSDTSLEDAANTGAHGIRKETIGGTEYYTREYTVSATSAPASGKIGMTVLGGPGGTILASTGNTALENLGGTWYAPVSAGTGINGGTEYACRFKLCIPTGAAATTSAGSVSIYASASAASVTFYYFTNTNAGEQDFLIANPSTGTASASGFLRWGQGGGDTDPDPIPASIRVLKTDENGSALPGAEFSLDGSGGYHASGVTDNNGAIFWSDLPADQTYTITEVSAPEGYQLADPVNVIVSEGEAKQVTVTDGTEKTLRIYKQDAQNKASLAGATFHFEQIDGDFRTDGRTLGDGMIEFTSKELPYGAYRITETDPPAGYEKDTSVKTVSWDGTADIELVFTNVRKPGFEVLKVDAETGSPLANAVFNVYQDGDLIDSVQTNELGLATVSGVSAGYYEVEEIVAPAGYVLDGTRHGIQVDPYNPATSADAVIRVTNRARPALRIVKYDGQTRQPIPNTTFAVYRDSVFIGEYTTDATGEIYLYDLAPGTYRVEEKSTDSSHEVNSTPQEIELEAGVTTTYTLVFLNYLKPGIRIVKLDSQTLEPLANAKFRVSKVGGGFSNEYTSGANGEIELTGLESGSYTVEELAAPDGYLIDDAQRIIKVEAGEKAEFVFTDTRKPSFRLVKLDSLTGERLPGATIRIAKIEDGTHYLDRVTDTDGEINISDLEPGVYSVQEMTAPEGYVLNGTEFHVELFPGQMSQLVMSNDHKPDLRIIKQDADTGEFLAGAVFKVKKADGSTLTSGLTGPNGEIFLKSLEPGVYEVIEQAPPVGYLPARHASQLITLEANKLGTVIFQNYEKPTLTVNKISSISGEPLKGARFRVTYRSNNTETGEINNLGYYLTDDNGQFRLTDLTDGWYTVTELESVPGYSIKEATQEVYIRGGEDKVLTFENTPLSALVVYKYDTVTGEAVSGAVFQVKKMSDTSGTGGTVIGTYTTGPNGSFTVTGLAEGVYIVEELASDSGHIVDSAPQTVYISGKQMDVVEVYFGNTPKGGLLVKKKDASTHEPLADVQFFVTDSDGGVIGNANGYFTTDSAGTFLIDGLNPGETLIVRETRALDGYVLDDVPQAIRIKAGQVVELEFLNARTGSVLIKKIDAVTHEPLSDVQFYITDSSGAVIGTDNGYFVTDSAGTILIDGLKPGTTIVARETRARDGYVLDDTPQTVLVRSNRTVTLEFRNAPNGGLIIRKIDSITKQPLPGAVFTVTTSAGEYVDNFGGMVSSNGRYTTNENGQIHLYDLKPGSYVVTETEAPYGYVLNSEPQTVRVNANDTQTLTFTNPPKGNLIIEKYDKVTGDPLAGAEFKITTASGELVPDNQGLTSTNGIYTTDAQGQIVLSLLNPDTYVVTETKAPANYKLDANSQTVVVRAGDTQTLRFYDDPLCVLTILKRDANTKEPLAKAVFSVKYSDGTEVGPNNGRYTTGSDGTATVTGIAPNATVIVTEEKAPTGYLRDETPKTIVVRSGAANTVIFDDEPTQTLIIRKFIQGTDNEPLAGVAFKVVYGDGAAVGPDDGVYYTDRAGEIVLEDLEPGKTVIAREIKTVDGFVLDGIPQDIEIRAGRVQQLTFWNRRQGSLVIRKLDAITKEPLPGAEFEVRYADGRVVDNFGGKLSSNGYYVTDSKGEITITGLTGTVVVTEMKAPAGYTIDANGKTQTVVVNPDDTQTLTFTDLPNGALLVQKFDSVTREPLEGAQFKITTASGELVADNQGLTSTNGLYTTDAQGQIVLSGLNPDTYIVTETKAPANYKLDEQAQTVVIGAADTQSLSFYNEPLCVLTIVKRDAGTKEPLAGAEFSVRYGSTSQSVVTGKDGAAVITGIAPNTTVTVTEEKAPTGYIKDSLPQTITVQSGADNRVVFDNEPTTTLIIRKFIQGTEYEPLAGVAFRVIDGTGAAVGPDDGVYYTDEAGEIVLTDLTPGMTVKVREISTVDGFVLNGNPQDIQIIPGQVQQLTFWNSRKGTLVIRKLDSVSMEPLPGAEFKITYADGRVVDTENGKLSSNGIYTTNSRGEITITGVTGTLVVEETKSPIGYAIDPNGKTQTVVVNAEDTQTLSFYNTPLCTLTITKRDANTKEPLAGAEFTVKVGETSRSYVTGRDGTITVTGIAPNATATVTETKAPSGYVKDAMPQTITVQSGEENRLYFDDEPTTALIIQKFIQGTDYEPLAGVGFRVVDGNGGAVGPDDGLYYTDRNGEIALDGLTPGMTVKAREVSTVDGYILDGTPQDIEIHAGEVQHLTFWNAKKGTLVIRKVDSVTGAPLGGAEFKITYADGSVVDTENGKLSSNGIYTTDSRGEITVTGVTGVIVVTETKAPDGYLIDPNGKSQTVTVNADDMQTLVFRNDPTQVLTIQKYITDTATPIAGVTFLVTSSDGTVIGPNNGEYLTDRNGRIVISGLVPGTTVTAREVKTVDGYVMDGTPQSILIKQGEAQQMTFYNTPAGGLIITKSDAESGARLSGVRFEVRKKNGEIVGTYATDRNGVIRLPDLEKGWYVVIEREAATGYLLDDNPQEIEVRDGETATLALVNRKTSNILIHKIDADTGKGIYGVTFLLYDSNHNPIGEYVSDNNGYVYMDSGLADGRYYIRELKAAEGYILDDELKTFYVRYGATSEITWKNTAIRGQIQIVKKSADDNPINGLPAGTLLEGAVFEIYDKSGNLVDTVKTGRDGRAASKLLPLSRYTVKEMIAPNYYAVNPTTMTAYLEHEGQIVSFEVLDNSITTGVSIKKTGYAEVMPGGTLRYAVTQIANTSNLPLASFYWRDTLPGQAALEKVVTGTYNQALNYKIVYKTSASGDAYLTLADNLSTTKNYVLDARPATLGLAANERVTEIMFVFGQVQGGFAEVETAYIYATASSSLSNGSSIVNVADVGGLFNGQWIQGVSRWTTTVYSRTITTLPKTGY